MEIIQKVKSKVVTLKNAMLASLAIVTGGVLASTATAADTWQLTINETLEWLVSVFPLFGDLITGVGDHLVWPVVTIIIIMGIATVVLSFFGMIGSIAIAIAVAIKGNLRGFGKPGKSY